MKYRISVIANDWPDGKEFIEASKKELGDNFVIVPELDLKADLIVYMRIPWNLLFKSMVKKFPEFKQDDALRKRLRKFLSGTERGLDKLIESIEDKYPVLVLDDSIDTPFLFSDLIKFTIRRK